MSQPVAPVLLYFYSWPAVLGGVVAAGFFWRALVAPFWVAPSLVSRFRSSYAHFGCVSSVRRQKRSMDARMSPVDFVQRNGLGAAFLILI